MVDGLTAIASSLGAKATMDRLEAEVKARGLTVFARIDHAGGAAKPDCRYGPPNCWFSAMQKVERR